MSKKYTLYQVLKRSGLFASRSALVNAVNHGKVKVDGVVTKALKFQLNPNSRKVTCLFKEVAKRSDGKLRDGGIVEKEVEMLPLRYFMLNKAQAYSCQRNDRKRYVLDLMKVEDRLKNSLFPIGRLDVPTRGLLLVTNDGEFSARVLDPKRKVAKTYLVLCKGALDDDQLDELKDGVVIRLDEQRDYRTLPPVSVEKVSDHKLLLTIIEGKYRQVRKMLEAVGNKVVDLQRVAIGGLELSGVGVAEGNWKEFSGEEVKKLVFGAALSEQQRRP